MASEAKEEDSKPKKSKAKLFIIVAVALVLAAVPAFMLLNKGDKEEVEIDESLFYKKALLDTFIVNLMSTKNFLKTTILIEYNPFALERWISAESKSGKAHGGGSSDPFALPEPLMQKKPAMSDVVIKVLSSKKAEELLTVQGKENLKEELISGLNDALKATEPIITNVLFSEFIIQ
jgi:flagellar FliL protein